MVKLCTRKTDKQEFAVKIITKSSLRGTALQCIKTEVDVLKRVAGHPKSEYSLPTQLTLSLQA